MDAAKMNALEGAVADVDATSPEAQAEATQAAAEQAKAVTEAEAWAVLPTMVGSMVCMIEPALAPVYAPENCQAWGAAMVPVAQKYGWTGPSALPELGLVFASAGFAIPTYLAIKTRVAAIKAAKPAAPEPALPGATVTAEVSPVVAMEAAAAVPVAVPVPG